MNALYRGNLLEEDRYEEWAFFEREKFKSIYLDSIISLCKIYETQGMPKKSEPILLKALSIDRYNEEICSLLMKYYSSQNQRGRALKIYSEFEKRMARDLNVKPDIKLVVQANVLKN